MDVITTKENLRASIKDLRLLGNSIALVPTMGALHAGHVSLVHHALQKADKVIATIFVNPTQFGANEDFSQYPRTEEEDIEKLRAAGAAIAYLPEISEMYLPDARTVVSVKGISDELCGAVRPGHFDGVATIVMKLLMQTLPDYAVFGEKDYQQLHIIKRMVLDLDIPVNILGAEIIREEDGLAMSSRNRYLNETQRCNAPYLYSTLQKIVQDIKAGQAVNNVIDTAKIRLQKEGFDCVDYIELRDTVSFQRMHQLNAPARLLAAARMGKTRLIDNISVEYVL